PPVALSSVEPRAFYLHVFQRSPRRRFDGVALGGLGCSRSSSQHGGPWAALSERSSCCSSPPLANRPQSRPPTRCSRSSSRGCNWPPRSRQTLPFAPATCHP